MGFLGDLFDDVVDITTSPVRLGAKIIDKTLDPFDDSCTFFSDTEKTLRDAIKTKGK